MASLMLMLGTAQRVPLRMTERILASGWSMCLRSSLAVMNPSR